MPMAGTAATTDSFACLAFRRAPDLAASAVPAADDAVSETLPVTVDATVDAPAVPNVRLQPLGPQPGGVAGQADEDNATTGRE
jgi:hypothetical protein